MRKVIYSILIFPLILLIYPPVSAQAQYMVLFDDFSRDLSQWQPVRDDGHFWNIVDGALEAYIPSPSTITELLPTADSWLLDSKNYVFEFDFTALQGGDKNVSFGVIDLYNWYEIHFTPSLTELVRVKDGTVVWREQTEYILKTGVTYHLYITFIKGRVILFVNDVLIFDFTDPTFENNYGKIGIKASTGGIFPTKIRVDNMLVRDIPVQNAEGKKVSVEPLKQTDPRWSSTEYDTAAHWASALRAGISFKEWACNLVAQTMLLKSHGISTLPDGSPLTPVSLNTWLIENKGYYNAPNTGNINPHSISQLSATISKKYGTPKLEYTYIKNNWFQTAISEIDKGNPVIIELEGHFVLAYGYTSDKSDLYIHDPAYSYTTLSAHHLQVKSIRLYTPSNTDLSYITLTSTSPVEVITTPTVNTIQSYQEKLSVYEDASQGLSGPATYITEIPKPNTGLYTFSIEASSPSSIELTSFNQIGEAQELLAKDINKGLTELSVNYEKNGSSSINVDTQTTLSYSDFKKTIKQLSKTKAIKKPYLEKILVQMLKPIESFSITNQRKVLQVIKIIISSTPKSVITRPAQSLLLDQVKLLLAALKQH